MRLKIRKWVQNEKIGKIPSQANVCPFFYLPGQECDSKKLAWAGKLAEAKNKRRALASARIKSPRCR